MAGIRVFSRFIDSSIFQNLVKMQKKKKDIPEPEPISQNSVACTPYIFDYNEVFALSKNLMCPYAK